VVVNVLLLETVTIIDEAGKPWLVRQAVVVIVGLLETVATASSITAAIIIIIIIVIIFILILIFIIDKAGESWLVREAVARPASRGSSGQAVARPPSQQPPLLNGGC